MSDQMHQGTVKSIVESRGFGFLRVAGSTEELFFHVSQLKGLEFDASLVERRVVFEIEVRSDGKRRAVNVRGAE